MMMFDVLRKLNDEITVSLNEGLPGPTVPLLIGTTDGYNVTVHFMDKVVWDSTKWKYTTVTDNPTDNEVRNELDRIEQHIRHEVMEYLTRLYNIQW